VLELGQCHLTEVVAQLVEAVRVALWHLSLEIVDESVRVVEAEALAGPGELEQHNRFVHLHLGPRASTTAA
jgi:hypothetical protein